MQTSKLCRAQLGCLQVAGYGNAWIRGEDTLSRVSPKQIQQSVDASLQRLGTDYLDLLQARPLPKRFVLGRVVDSITPTRTLKLAAAAGNLCSHCLICQPQHYRSTINNTDSLF